MVIEFKNTSMKLTATGIASVFHRIPILKFSPLMIESEYYHVATNVGKINYPYSLFLSLFQILTLTPMKPILTLLLIAFSPFFALAQTNLPKAENLPQTNTTDGGGEMGIMTFNIRVGKGMDLVNDLQRSADIINRERPHVVALQEVDSVTVRTGGRDQARELGRLTGMYSAFASAMEFNGGKYGVGLLSREKPLSVRSVALPGREEQRVLLIAEFRNYVVASTHFSLTEADRLASAQILINETAGIDKPLFFAGDLNALPESATIKLLEQHFTLLTDKRAFTFPADTPDRCIDYIFARNPKAPFGKEFQVISTTVLPEPLASDHRPVMVKLSYSQSY